MDIGATQKAVHQTAQTHGWWDTADDCNVPTKLALAAGELVGEALEDYRAGKMDLYYQWRDPADGKLKRLTQQELEARYMASDETNPYNPADYKPCGFGIELADAMIRIFDLAEWLDIPLDALIDIKMQYNDTRPMRHGGKKV